MECGGLTPLLHDAARRVSLKRPSSRPGESGVEPPHSKTTLQTHLLAAIAFGVLGAPTHELTAVKRDAPPPFLCRRRRKRPRSRAVDAPRRRVHRRRFQKTSDRRRLLPE